MQHYKVGTYKLRESNGRFTNLWKSIKWFLKRVSIGSAILLTAISLYAGGQMNPNQVDLIPVVEAKDEFSDFPLLVEICKAESQSRQFTKDGKVLRGTVNRSDLGFCQINEPIWNDKARELGYDIYTEQGNKDMSVFIFLHEGGDPWSSSKCSAIKKTNCWK